MRIDVSRPETWPEELMSAVEDLGRSVPRNRYLNDLEVPFDAAGPLWDAMEGHHLTARHFTRLLDHEAETIRAEGLRLYSRELFDQRIDGAVNRGLIPPGVGEVLRASSIPATDPTGLRRGLRHFVWMTVGRTFEEHPDGVMPLMQSWGGEGIYFAAGAQPHRPFLQTLGRPAIVHVLLPVDLARGMTFRPCLGRLLLGRYRGLDGVSADLCSRAGVPSEAIERVEFLS